MTKLASSVLLCAGVVAMLIGGFVAAAPAPELSIALQTSSWSPAFKQLADTYAKETGVRININFFPYEGLFEKETTAMTAQSSEFDILSLDDPWTGFFYKAGYVVPLQEIDPGFKLDPSIIEFSNALRWDAKTQYTSKAGMLMSLPENGNFFIFYYRKDLYDQAGVRTPPRTWDDVLSAAQKLHAPGKMIGFVSRGQAGNPIAADWLHFLWGYRGDVFASMPDNWTVTLNSDAGRKALGLYLQLMQSYGPPGPGNFSQTDVLQAFVTGRAAQGLGPAVFWANIDDPKMSTVPYKIEMTVIPRPAGGVNASLTAEWVMGVSKFSRNKAAALAFMKWATSRDAQMAYELAGGGAIRKDIYDSPLAYEAKYRYMRAMIASAAVAKPRPRIPEEFQIEQIMGKYLNQALIKQIPPDAALSQMSGDIYALLKSKGYPVKQP